MGRLHTGKHMKAPAGPETADAAATTAGAEVFEQALSHAADLSPTCTALSHTLLH